MVENSILNADSTDHDQIHSARLRIGLRIHWIVYFIINLSLFAIYRLTGRGYPWYVWVIASWGLGLSIHTLSVRIILFNFLPEDRSIRIHGGVQLSVMIFLIFVDIFTGNGISWSVYPCLVLIYAWLNHFIYYRFFNRISKSDDGSDVGLSGYQRLLRYYISGMPGIDSNVAKARAKRAIGNQIGFRYHLLTFAIISLLLFLIDLSVRARHWWFYWPCLSWGMLVLVHGFIARMVKISSLYHQLRRNSWLVYPFIVCLYFFAIDFIPDKLIGWALYPSIPILIISVGVGLIIRAVKKEKIHTHLNNQRVETSEAVKTDADQNLNTPVNLYCPSCGSEIKYGQITCDFCGNDIRPPK
jgi:hypothetical protein